MSTGPEGFVLTSQPLPLRHLLRDLWSSRSLVRLLAKKDFFARYRRASFGILWAVGMPLVQAVVFAVVFSRVARIDVPGNYGIFVFAATVPWTFFISSVGSAATAIVSGNALTSKTYFPRAVLPIVSVATETYGLACSLAVVLVATAVVGPGLGLRALLLVPATMLVIALTVSFGLVLSALHVYFRDTQYVVEAVSRPWFFVTPIIFPLTFADGLLRTLIEINPATGMVLLFRAAIFPTEPGWETALWWSIAWTVVSAVVGVVLHRRFDRVFVDLL
jgi:lipopolysaccharide transport system permease protein